MTSSCSQNNTRPRAFTTRFYWLINMIWAKYRCTRTPIVHYVSMGQLSRKVDTQKIPLFQKYCVVLLQTASWWRNQMKAFSALLILCAGNSPAEFPLQRQVTRSLDLRLNKRLIKQSRRRDLRRHRTHYAVTVLIYICNNTSSNKNKHLVIKQSALLESIK